MATWAKGVDFKNSNNTKRIGGIGVYGADTATQKLYIGLGTEPWNNAGLQLTSSAINFKGNKIYHAGDKPTASEIGAAASNHTHSYLPLSGGTMTGTLELKPGGSILTGAGIATGNTQLIGTTTDTIYFGNPKTKIILESNSTPSVSVNGTIYTMYHTGNKPTASEIGALPTSGGSRLVIGTASSTASSNAQIEIQAPNSGIPRIALHSSGRTRASIGTISGDGVDIIAERNGSLRIQNDKGYLDVGCKNDGYAHYNTDRANHWFNTTVRVDGEIYAGNLYSKQVFHTGWCGNVPNTATMITNLNSQLTSGWYSINPSTSGRPSGVDYGVVLQIRWHDSQDFYQILLSSNNARMYTRGYINGGYTAWNEK